MSSSNKTMARRLFLRGVGGVTLGLPLLEAFQPKRADAAPAQAPYLAVVCSANGVVQARSGEAESWWPTMAGPLTTASMLADSATRTTGELSEYASRLLIVRGVRHTLGENGCNHASACAQILTGTASLSGNSNQTVSDSESLDTIIARVLNPVGVEPLFLHAGLYQAGGSGFNVPSYVSYEGPRQQRTAFDSPLRAYERITGTAGTQPASAGDPLQLRRVSVNDLLRREIQALQARPELTTEDHRRLQQHFDTIHDLEIQMRDAALLESQIAEFEAVESGLYAFENHETIQRLHTDLMVFALSSGYTRVAVLQVGDREDDHEYVIDGVRVQFHTASHRTLPDSYELCKRVDRIQIGHFKYFLDQLAAVTTPAGTLLDEGVVVNTNQLGTGPDHSMLNLPYIISGGAGGYLTAGQMIELAGVPNSMMLNTLAAAVGVETSMGGTSGVIDAMLA